MRKKAKGVMAKALVLALTITTVGIASPDQAQAAKKPKLSKSKITITVKKTAKIKIKNVKANKIKKLALKSNKKKIATVKKNGKTAFTITGKKVGKATITAKIALKGKKKPVSLKVTVTIKKQETPVVTSTPTIPSETPVITPNVTPDSSPDITLPPTPPPPVYVKKELKDVTVTVDEPTNPETMKESNARQEDVTVAYTQDFEDGNLTVEPTGTEDAKFVVDNLLRDRNGTEELSIVEEGKGGGKCLKVSNRTKTWNGLRIDLEKSGDIISKGGKYKFTADVKYGETSSGMSLVFSSEIKMTEEEKEPACSNLNTLSAPTTWTQIEGEFSVPDDFYHYAIYLENPYISGEVQCPDLYIDNIKIECMDKVVPVDNLASLYETYKDLFDFVGTACSGSEIAGESAVGFMKSQYNCVTPGNEAKPDAVMGTDLTLVSLDEVKDNPDYYIPTGYAEDPDNVDSQKGVVVPQLNFASIDSFLANAKKAGLKVRMHTLIWHEQTPHSFFQKNYSTKRNNSKNNYNVSADTMDKRIEFYIRSVMNHVLTSENADVIYAWDAVNEYFHSDDADTRTEPTYYKNIYNTYVGTKGGNQTNMSTEPSYVKLAFKIAHEELVEHERTDIKLFYNDFNTYDVAKDICHLVNYINYDEKLCDGVGMQSHLDLAYPTVESYKKALEMFRVNIPDVEIQITELDATMNYKSGKFEDKGQTDKDQAAYYYDIMKAVLQEKQAGANITGLIIWGLYDGVSWRAAGTPLIFNGLNSPKSAYYAMIDVKKDVYKNE